MADAEHDGLGIDPRPMEEVVCLNRSDHRARTECIREESRAVLCGVERGPTARDDKTTRSPQEGTSRDAADSEDRTRHELGLRTDHVVHVVRMLGPCVWKGDHVS